LFYSCRKGRVFYPPMSSANHPLTGGGNSPYTSTMKKDALFESLFIEAVAEQIDDSDLSHSEFGRAVFGNASGDRLWRSCRGEKRKRTVSIGEAYVMAEALGVDLPTLLWRIIQAKTSQGKLP